MRFTLMNADHEVLDFDIDFDKDYINKVHEIKDYRYAPIYFKNDNLEYSLYSFLRNRSLSFSRKDGLKIIEAAGVRNELELAARSFGLSLTDCYWYKPENSSLKWEDVNCFDRAYDTSFGEAILRCDYKSLAQADPMVPDCTLSGVSRKAWIRIDGASMLLKSEACEDIFIEEAELLSAKLTERLLDPDDYIAYKPFVFEDKRYIACRGMVRNYEEFIPAGHIMRMIDAPLEIDSFKVMTKDSSILKSFTETLNKMGAENITAYYAKLGAAYNLTLAGDCHLENFGFIRDLNTLQIRPAPLFDRGRSFGSFGEPIANGQISAVKVTLSSPKTMFMLMLFNSIVFSPDWDYSWFDPKKLEGFHDDIEQMLGRCEEATPEYREMLKAAFDYQLDYFCKAAGFIDV